jgi:hypothetical protein
VLIVRPQLIRLFEAYLPRSIDVTSIDEVSTVEAKGAHTPLISLPYCLGLEASAINGNPYLRVDSRVPPLPVASDPACLKLGMVWAGSGTNWTDGMRSATVAELRPAIALENVAAYSLQVGERAHDAIVDGVISTHHLIRDFLDTAGLAAQMDAVVAVDTSVAHLSAALGVRTFVLVHTGSDWRWGLADRTIWYDAVRVLRQVTPGDWSNPVRELVSVLRELSGLGGARSMPLRPSV